MPRAQATAANDILMEWYVLHSLKSSSISAGLGPFPSCLEVSLVILEILLFVGLTFWGFVSWVSPGTAVNRYLHTANVYGMGANEKKDAPYKISRKSGRNAEATK